MSASSPSLPRSAVITRLRSAGCVFAEDEAQLLISTARTPADLAAMLDRRTAGLPLEHVLGWAEFCGLRIAVDPGVFVPRRRTEFLVAQAAGLARVAAARDGHAPAADPAKGTAAAPRPAVHTPAADSAQGAVIGPRPVVVDLCCGSGAMAAALVAALGRIEVHAVDLDPAAVRCARRNLPGGHVHQGDLYQPLPAALRGRVDVLVASPPYVPTEEIRLLPPEARIHEPRVALDGGADGLDIVCRVTGEAALWLAPGGCLLVETSEGQASQAVETVAGSGLIPQMARSRELNATVVIGTMPAAPAHPRPCGGAGPVR